MHPFLATECAYSSSAGAGATAGNGATEGNMDDAAVVGGRDAEEQRVVLMTLPEVRDAAMGGRFVEVQWSNTVALALLHLANGGGGGGGA